MLVHDRVTRHCESQVSRSKTQHNDSGQGLNPDHLTGLQCAVPLGWDVDEEQINNTFYYKTQIFWVRKKGMHLPYTRHYALKSMYVLKAS